VTTVAIVGAQLVTGSATPLARASRSLRLRWLVLAAAAAVGIAIGVATAMLTSRGSSLGAAPTKPVAAWPPGAKPAPTFRLTDQNGRPVSLRALRGRVTVVSFIDPLCRNLCPLEAKALNQVGQDLGPSRAPAIVAVSVNPWANTRTTFREDARAWRLTPAWRWAYGPYAKLARVWRKYQIGVQVEKKTLAGVTVHEIVHTEAAYLIGPRGYQRALFLYPFRAADVEHVVRQLAVGD
jgi:cytochrome oxidase Cu insertion factor (SCO1/SenC/PrrC family)